MRMTDIYDVVVVGGGINGLTAAAELARAGQSVCLVEGRDQLGGFIRSDSLGDAGYVHDVFSSWHSLFVGGAAYAVLGSDLRRHGLVYCTDDAPDAAVCASAAPDGRVTVAYRDPELTAEAFAHDTDRDAYRAMLERTDAGLRTFGSLLTAELRDFRRLRDLVSVGRRLGRRQAETLVRDLVTSGRSFVERTFAGAEVDHLWVPWLLHAGLAPDQAGGGLMLPVFAATTHGGGLPVVQGGAGGSRLHASQAVVASVSPNRLYDTLLAGQSVADRARREIRGYRYGPGAVQIHLALSAPPPWTSPVLRRTPLVHLSDGSAGMAIASAQVRAGLLPQRPSVVVGQQYLLDPSRVPAGAAALWIQLQEAPYAPRGDSAGRIPARGSWTEEVTTAYLERVIDLIEEQAPGLRSSILSRHVMTPVDIERANPNAVRGYGYGGSLELDQSLLWRPVPGAARHRTCVPGLWHIGAATHPGHGLSGGSGHLAARMIMKRPPRGGRVFPTSRSRR